MVSFPEAIRSFEDSGIDQVGALPPRSQWFQGRLIFTVPGGGRGDLELLSQSHGFLLQIQLTAHDRGKEQASVLAKRLAFQRGCCKFPHVTWRKERKGLFSDDAQLSS